MCLPNEAGNVETPRDPKVAGDELLSHNAASSNTPAAMGHNTSFKSNKSAASVGRSAPAARNPAARKPREADTDPASLPPSGTRAALRAIPKTARPRRSRGAAPWIVPTRSRPSR